MPKIKKPIKKKTLKKTTNLIAVKAKAKSTNLTLAKQKELQKLVSAYQQVGISLTKLLQPTK